MRARRAVFEAVPAPGAVAGDPFGNGGARDLKAFGDAGLRPAILDHKFDEFAAPSRRQGRVGNVRDEGLRGIALSVVTQSIPEVLTFLAHATLTTSVGRTASASFDTSG